MPSNPAFAKALGLTDEERDILDAGNEHRYDCRCDRCKLWWQMVGPDGDPDPYGPFSIEEIEDESKHGKNCKKVRLEMQAEERGEEPPF